MRYSVWLFTRPLSGALGFSSFADTSEGKEYLRHWGVLVSEMTIVDAKAILARSPRYSLSDNMELGTMYELFREKKNLNNVRIHRPFNFPIIREQWRRFATEYVGETEKTHETIELEGIQDH